ncbi:hypothetical protein WKT22_03144 [Candidatus Lokiarchaeum ossiferum]
MMLGCVKDFPPWDVLSFKSQLRSSSSLCNIETVKKIIGEIYAKITRSHKFNPDSSPINLIG